MSSSGSIIEDANEALIVDGNFDAIDQYFAADYTVHLTDRDLGGHDTIRRVITMLRQAFTDLEVTVEILVASDERVAWQRTIHGTHSGSYAGFPATGKPLVWREMATSIIADGKIAEEWLVSELAERLLASHG